MQHIRLSQRLAPLVLAVVLLLTHGCNILPVEYQPQAAPIRQAETSPEFKTFKVERGDLRLTETISFRYEPIRVAQLGFPVGGLRLEALYVDMGDLVEEGNLLAELEGGQDAARIRELESSLEEADVQKKYMREDHVLAQKEEEIWQDALGSEESVKEETLAALAQVQEEELQFFEAERHILELELQDARDRLAVRQIYAPFDGIVTYARVSNLGESVRKDESIIQVSDSSISLFVGRIPDHDYFDVGSQWDLDSRDITYPVEIINPEDYGIEGDDGSAYARLLVDDVALEADTRGSIEVVLDESLEALFVPRRSVFIAGGQPMVYIQNPDGVRIAREVETGLETREYIEITSGLEEDEVIIRD